MAIMEKGDIIDFLRRRETFAVIRFFFQFQFFFCCRLCLRVARRSLVFFIVTERQQMRN